MKFVALDFETSGTDPQTDRVIQVGAVRMEDGQVAARFSSFVASVRSIPVRVKRMTGITEADLAGAPSAHEVMQDLLSFIGNSPIVSHNASFEQGFLEAEASRAGIRLPELRYVDTVEFSRVACPDAHVHRLDSLASSLGIPQPKHHDALEDAQTCASLYLKLDEMARSLGGQTLELMLGIADESWTLRAEIERALQGAEDRPFRPGRPAPQVAEPLQGTGEYRPVDTRELAGLLAAGGPLSGSFENYEHRREQVQMMALVADALNDGKHLLVEAGTGTGKSLAYLIPCARWAIDNQDRIVVSTQTINLQEQLLTKDIPLMRQAFGWDFRVALLKGRANYVCLRRLYDVLHHGLLALDPEERRALARLVAWLSRTSTGDRGEVNIFGPAEAAFARIRAEQGACASLRCPYRDRCFVTTARKEAQAAHIIIANHSLVFSDIAAENKVLPAYSHIVFDEAHHLEDSATNHLGVSLPLGEVAMFASEWTLPNAFMARVQRLPLTDLERECLRKPLEEASHASSTIQQALASLGTMLSGVLLASSSDASMNRLTLRLLPGTMSPGEEEAVQIGASDLTGRLKTAAAALGEFVSGASSEAMPDDLLDIAQQAASSAMTATECAASVREVLLEDDVNTVRWLEGDADRLPMGLGLRSAPVNVSAILKDRVFDSLRSVIMTSATLSVEGRCDYLKERLGLDAYDDDRLLEELVGSPFDFASHALLLVPDDMPPVQKTPLKEFSKRMTSLLAEIVASIGGRTLVLFTSHKLLQEVYYSLKPFCEKNDICLLAQGIDGSRTRLIEELRSSDRTVVFGSSSFWEGVDVPGQSLSCVIMARLPFWPPTMPVVQARHESLSRAGKSAFNAMALPQAVIRFKQGFGRLIRTKTDRGAVIIVDHRISPSGSNYGSKFLNSLPGPRLFTGPSKAVVAELCDFLGVSPFGSTGYK
ncbi:MAG: helicase C-terminal domain-containing protein [Bacillota bacterium]|nr:helicase C-terminal domain-containing protein [Bacillota bacterium]